MNFDVHFIHLGNSQDEKKSTKDFLLSIGVHRHTVVRYNFFNLIYGLVIGLFQGLPLQVSLYYKTNLGKILLKFYKPGDYVFAHLVRSVPHVCNKALVDGFYLEMTDTISRNYNILKANVPFPLSLIFHFEELRLIKYELFCSQTANHTFLVSLKDKEYLSQKSSCDKISVTPLAIDHSEHTLSNWNQSNKHILLIANFNTIQNFKGTKHFIKEIFPDLSVKFNLKLKLVGNISKKHAKYFNKFKNVFVLGKVSSLSSTLSDTLCGICPIHISAGMQTKILDYMSFGLPVLSSTRSSLAIDPILRKYIYQCDTLKDYSHNLDLIINQNIIDNSKLYECSILVKSFYSEKSLESNLNNILLKSFL